MEDPLLLHASKEQELQVGVSNRREARLKEASEEARLRAARGDAGWSQRDAAIDHNTTPIPYICSRLGPHRIRALILFVVVRQPPATAPRVEREREVRIGWVKKERSK
jgi:hypothetical protein